MSSVLKMKNLMEEFTLSEKKLADYILKNIDGVYHLTALELAEYANTSAASVVRFSKRLGYEGFQELKIAIAKDMAQRTHKNEKVYEAVGVDDSIEDIIEKIAAENKKAIEDTISLVANAAIEEAIKAMIEAKHIYLYGVGASALVAKDLQYKLVRINISTSAYMDSHIQVSSATNVCSEDVVIGISHSGRTIETYKAMKIAKEKGAKIISITKYGKSSISDLADIKIETTGVETGIRAGAIASRIAQLTIVDILYIGIVKQDYKRVAKKLKNSKDVIDTLKM